jgi:pilus assembly protein Flp/PilA
VLALANGGGLLRERRYKTNMSSIDAVTASIYREEDGQGLAEYALILALIAIVAIIALIFLGGQVSKILSAVGNSV